MNGEAFARAFLVCARTEIFRTGFLQRFPGVLGLHTGHHRLILLRHQGANLQELGGLLAGKLIGIFQCGQTAFRVLCLVLELPQPLGILL